MKSFFVRLGSGIVLLTIIIATGIIGGPVLYGLNVFIALMGYWEFLRVFQIERSLPGYLGWAAVVCYYVTVYLGLGLEAAGPLVLIAFLLLLMAVYVVTFPKYKTEEIMAAYFGLIYVAVMLSFLYQTRTLRIEGEETPLIYFLIFICSWGCDTCAYAVGMLIGKHKMTPVLSPKKSIEGGIGGVVGAALIGLIYASVFGLDWPEVVILCAAGAVVSQIGDLAASAIKRNHGIKDYGHLIPGHGGILDRFDSVIFTAPIVYTLAALLLR